MQPLDTSKFGITLLLNNVGFSAELQRDNLNEILTEIDDQLTEGGAPDDNETRMELVMQQVDTVSEMVVHKEIDHAFGVADIAYAFIYCLGKTVGFDQIEHVRGLTGSFLRNVLSINPCLGELEFKMESDSMRKVMTESPVGDWNLDDTLPPTVH